MNQLQQLLRWIAPLGVMEHHRRRFRMGRLGLAGTVEMETAVAACRYELWPLELRQSSAPWLLVDVGANDGEFSEAAARLARLSGVHAFEPQPVCHGALRSVLGSIPNSHLHGVAVGAEKGEIDLLCTANSRLSSVLPPDAQVAGGYEAGDFAVEQRLKVPLERLDDVIPKDAQIGLLKIDVQGYERAVLAGAVETLQRTQALLMEVNYVPHYEGGMTFDDLLPLVQQHGFRTFGISAPFEGPKGPLWADAMFVRR